MARKSLGLPEAAYEAGIIHRDAGRLPEAKDWLAKAIWRNHPRAALTLARLTLEEGAPGAGHQAAHLLREAATMGDPEAMFMRAELLLASPGAASQWGDARNLILQAAKAGHPQAMWALFQERQGEGASSGEVLELLRRAADAGLAEADDQLGTWMLEGKAGAVNPREARERILRAANAGLPEAMQAQWELLVKSGQALDNPAALGWLRRAAAVEHVPSLLQLGRILAAGGPADRAEAVALLKRAVAAGEAKALAQLHRMYHRGDCPAAELATLGGVPATGLGRTIGRLKSMFQGKG